MMSQSLADHGMAIDRLAMILRSHLPACAGEVESIMSNLRDGARHAFDNYAERMLTGHGLFGSHYRRNQQLAGETEEKVEKLLETLLPVRWSEVNNSYPFRQFVWKMFGRYQYNSHYSGWLEDRPPHHLQGLTLQPYVKQDGRIRVSHDNVASISGGLYWAESWSNYGTPKRVLVLRYTPEVVVELHEEGDLYIWNYVRLERCWVRHQDTRYIELEMFKDRFAETFRDCEKPWPSALTQDDLIATVKAQLRTTPIKSKSKEEWKEKVEFNREPGHLFAYRQMNQEDDFTAAEVFVYRYGHHQLTFRFTEEGDTVAYGIVDNAPSYHHRSSGPFGVTSWKDLPLWNKITLAKECVDTIVRVHQNENRPAVEEPSSEPTTET